MKTFLAFRGQSSAHVVIMAFLLLTGVISLAQGGGPTPVDRGKPSCGVGPGSKPLNLEDEAACAAYDIVHSSGKRDAEIFDGYSEPLIFLALAQGLGSQEASKVVLRFAADVAETKRTDKQIGASASALGSTTATEKAGIADLLGIAIENGTIQQEVNGSTLTLSSSPYALTAWAHGDTAQNYLQHENDLGRIGVSATFNLGNPQDVLSNATRKQLAEWSVRFRLNRDHSTRSKKFGEWWQSSVGPRVSQEAIVLTEELSKSFKAASRVQAMGGVQDKFRHRGLPPNEALRGQGFVQAYLDAHAGESDAQVVAGLRDELLLRLKQEVTDQVDSFGLNADEKKRIINVVVAGLASAHELAEQAVKDSSTMIDELSARPIYTLAYTNVRDTTTSDYSVVKFLFEKGTSTTGKLVFNAGSSFYSKPDRTKNEQTVRDYATALSWETRLGRSPLVLYDADQSQMTLSFSGRYQRLLENRHQAGKKADLAVAQVKFEIPVFTGVTFPISVSYANASELIKEDHVHANFGFSFDTDKLYRLLDFKKKDNVQ